MADVLTSGPERPPGRTPRWLSGALAVAVAAGLAVLAVRADRSAPVDPPALALPSAPAVPLAPAPVERLTGEPGSGPAARLLVGGREPGILDLATGRFAPLHDALQMGGHAQATLGRGPGYTAATVSYPADEFARAALLRDDGTRVELGAVRSLLPMRDGSVLVSSCEPGIATCLTASVTADGTVRWRGRSRSSVVPVADTPYGLLTLVRKGEEEGALRLQDARTGRVTRLLGRTDLVLAVSPAQVAFQELDCEPGCPVSVVRLADGAGVTLPAPTGKLVAGAFSPDGRSLAVGLAGLGPDDPYAAAERTGYAVVFDLATRRWTPVPGVRTGARVAPVPVWVGDRLVLAAGIAGRLRIASWRPGDRTPTVLAASPPGPPPDPTDIALLP